MPGRDGREGREGFRRVLLLSYFSSMAPSQKKAPFPP
jgi:hypothetical protein